MKDGKWLVFKRNSVTRDSDQLCVLINRNNPGSDNSLSFSFWTPFTAIFGFFIVLLLLMLHIWLYCGIVKQGPNCIHTTGTLQGYDGSNDFNIDHNRDIALEVLKQKLTGLRSRPFGCSLISWLEWVRVVKGGGGGVRQWFSLRWYCQQQPPTTSRHVKERKEGKKSQWGSGSASSGIVSRGLPAPNDFPPLCQRKKGGKEKSEETRKEMVSINLSNSKNLLPLLALMGSWEV